MNMIFQKVNKSPSNDVNQIITRALRDFFYVVSQDTENIVAFNKSKEEKIKNQYRLMKSKLILLNNTLPADELNNNKGLLDEIEALHIPRIFEYLTYVKNEGMYSPKDRQRNADVGKLPRLIEKHTEKMKEYSNIAGGPGDTVRQDIRKDFESIEKVIRDIQSKWKVDKESKLIHTLKVENLQMIITELTKLRDSHKFSPIYKIQKRTSNGEPIVGRFVGTVSFLIETTEKRINVLKGTTLSQGDVDVSSIKTKSGRIKAIREAMTRKWSVKEKEIRVKQSNIMRQLNELESRRRTYSVRLGSAVKERKGDLLKDITTTGNAIIQLKKDLLMLEKEESTFNATKQRNQTQLEKDVKLMGGKHTYKNKKRQDSHRTHRNRRNKTKSHSITRKHRR